MGKCLSKLLPASSPKASNSSVPDVHQSSERSLKQLFDREQQQPVGTTEELTAILEEEVSAEGQRYCIVETDEVHPEDGLFSSVDSIGSQHEGIAIHKDLDSVARNGGSSSDAQEIRTLIEEKCLPPSQTFQHVLQVAGPQQKNHSEPLESVQQSGEQENHGRRVEGGIDNEELESEQDGYEELLEAGKESQMEQLEAREERHNERAVEGRPTGAEQEEPAHTEQESHNAQHAAERVLTGGSVAEHKESEESHESSDSVKLSQVQAVQLTEGAPVSKVHQDASIAATEADASEQFNVPPETNVEAVNVQSVAEPADAGNMERELASAHVEAEETTETVPPSNAAAGNKADPTEDCVPGEAAADQPESGSSSKPNKPATDAGKELVPEHSTSGATTGENTVEEQHDQLKSGSSKSTGELVTYPPSGQVADPAGTNVEKQHGQLASDSAADAGNELVAEHLTRGRTTNAAENKVEKQHDHPESESAANGEITSAAEKKAEEQHGQLESGPSEFAADAGNSGARASAAAENKFGEQHDQSGWGPAADAGNELVSTGDTTSAAGNKVEELHGQLESGSSESAPDAGNLHVEQPTDGKTTIGSTSENVGQEPQAAHEVTVENPEERVLSDDSTAAEEAPTRLQASKTTDSPLESAAETGDRDGKVMESSGTFETFIDAEEQLRGDSDEEAP